MYREIENHDADFEGIDDGLIVDISMPEADTPFPSRPVSPSPSQLRHLPSHSSFLRNQVLPEPDISATDWGTDDSIHLSKTVS